MTFHDLCGKEISARGFAVHVKHCTGKDWQPKAASKKRYVNRVKAKQNKKAGKDSKVPGKVQPPTTFESKNIIKTINLKGEFETMSETINPKEKKSEEAKYECGACHTKFNDKMKYCPGCGVEFA